MSVRDEIIGNGTPNYQYPQHSLITDDMLAEAAADIEGATSLADLKVLAYALYVGSLDPDVLSAKLGEADAIARSIAGLVSELPAIDSTKLTAALSGASAGYAGRAQGLNQEEGWAFALFDLLHDCKSQALIKLFEATDPARIGIRWALQGYLFGADLDAVVQAFAGKGDALHIAAAGVLAEQSMETELSGRGTLTPISVLPRLARAAITGRIISDLLSRRKNAYQPVDAAKRREDMIQRLGADATQWMQAPADVKDLLAGSQGDEDVLVFILSLPLSARADREAKEQAHNLLLRSFQKIQRRHQLEFRDIPYVAGWMLHSLANAAIQIGLHLSLYEELEANLQCDEFAHDFAYDVYLYDRTRAIVLCAVGAIVAKHVADAEDVGRAAARLAEALSLLPGGPVTVFSEEATSQLVAIYGLKLPAR